MRATAAPGRRPSRCALFAEIALVLVAVLLLGGFAVPIPGTGPPSALLARSAPRPATAVPLLLQGSTATPEPAGLQPKGEAPVPDAASLEELVRALPGRALPSPLASGRIPPPPAPRTANASSLLPGLGGWFTGIVANASRPTEPLAGVCVTALPDTATDPCTYQDCGPGVTTPTGSFNVSCTVGADYVVASIAGFAENLTFATCASGTTTGVGTMLLVPDAYVTGRLVGDVVGSPALGGISVEGHPTVAAGGPNGSTGAPSWMEVVGVLLLVSAAVVGASGIRRRRPPAPSRPRHLVSLGRSGGLPAT